MTTKNNDRPLNIREEKFVAAYIRTGVGKEAAIEAGWSPRSAENIAWRKLKDPRIKAAVDAARADAAHVLGIDAAWILRQALDIIVSCSKKAPVTDIDGVQKVDAEGKPLYRMLDPSTARNMLTDVAKWTGVEKPAEVEVKATGGVLLVDAVPTEEEWSKKHGRT